MAIRRSSTITGWLARRLIRAVAVLVATSFLVSLLVHLVPGDPGRTLLGLRASPERVAALDHSLGVDRSIFQQWLTFLQHAVTGSFGDSVRFQRSVGSLLGERLPVTLWLMGYASVLVVAIGVPLAMVAVSAPGRWPDHVVRVFNFVALGAPSAVVGILAIQVLAIDHQVFPPGGFGDGVVGHLRSLLLPSLTLALGLVPLVVRSLRSAMLKVIGSDHVTVARAKGVPERRLRRRHILRNALPPAVVVLSVNLAYLVGSTLIVEKVFSLPGLGSLMLDGVSGRDFALVQGVTLCFAIIVTLIGLAADLLQAALDPRVDLT
jgi:ABC-type dipeptide/oligopeptide/nickel transport system permease component